MLSGNTKQMFFKLSSFFSSNSIFLSISWYYAHMTCLLILLRLPSLYFFIWVHPYLPCLLPFFLHIRFCNICWKKICSISFILAWGLRSKDSNEEAKCAILKRMNNARYFVALIYYAHHGLAKINYPAMQWSKKKYWWKFQPAPFSYLNWSHQFQCLQSSWAS